MVLWYPDPFGYIRRRRNTDCLRTFTLEWSKVFLVASLMELSMKSGLAYDHAPYASVKPWRSVLTSEYNDVANRKIVNSSHVFHWGRVVLLQID